MGSGWWKYSKQRLASPKEYLVIYTSMILTVAILETVLWEHTSLPPRKFLTNLIAGISGVDVCL
jgi:hypothetical protein